MPEHFLLTLNRTKPFSIEFFYSDEATFLASGVPQRLNNRGLEIEEEEMCQELSVSKLREYGEHVFHKVESDSPKVNVWCGLFHDKVIGPFLFQ